MKFWYGNAIIPGVKIVAFWDKKSKEKVNQGEIK